MIEDIQVQIMHYVKIKTESLVPEPEEMCDDSILIDFVFAFKVYERMLCKVCKVAWPVLQDAVKNYLQHI